MPLSGAKHHGKIPTAQSLEFFRVPEIGVPAGQPAMPRMEAKSG
jgi:hypothetical protein